VNILNCRDPLGRAELRTFSECLLMACRVLIWTSTIAWVYLAER